MFHEQDSPGRAFHSSRLFCRAVCLTHCLFLQYDNIESNSFEHWKLGNLEDRRCLIGGFWNIGATGNVDLLTQGKELIEDIPRRQNTMQNGNSFSSNPFLSGASELPSRASTTDQFVEKSIKSIVTWTAGRLSNYRQLVDAGPIPALLSVLFACQRCLGSGSSQTVEVNTLLLISYLLLFLM